MDPNTEIPQKEQVVVPKELGVKMAETTKRIEQSMSEVGIDVATTTGQMSLMAELGALAKDTAVQRLGILFKDAKAALGIVPFIGKINEWNITRLAKSEEKMMRAGWNPPETGAPAIARQSAYKDTLGGRVSTMSENEKGITQAAKIKNRAEKTWQKAHARINRAGSNATHDDLVREGTAANTLMNAKIALNKAKRIAQGDQRDFMNVLESQSNKMTADGKEPLSSATGRWVRKSLDIPTEQDYVRRYQIAQKRAEKLRSQGKHVSDAEIAHWVGNGEMPAVSNWEKAGRVAKGYAGRMFVESLGPIISPIPDVPPLVAQGSWALELFGQQWWAGLVPPVWQYLHNRYAEFKLTMDSSKKAYEIVMRHWEKKMQNIKDPAVAKAADMFLPESRKIAQTNIQAL